jgi:hypothetical protein
MIELNDNGTIAHLKVLKFDANDNNFTLLQDPTSITKLGHFGYHDKPPASSPILEHTTT